MQQHELRESVFEGADGVYVALVFAWLESQEGKFAIEADPILEAVRKRISGSHWLVKSTDLRLISIVEKPFPESDWPSLLSKIGIDDDNQYAWASFDAARCFVGKRLLELQTTEALLVSVG